ncbi:MAG: hypothetical protein ACREII_02875 [Nitrospiraceae bacterium]
MSLIAGVFLLLSRGAGSSLSEGAKRNNFASPMKRLGKSILLILGGLLILATATIVGLFIWGGYQMSQFDSPFDDRSFDPVVWKASSKDRNPDNPRGQMYEDLVKNHLRAGMTQPEVIALLGHGDEAERQDFISYNLGMWSGFRVDYDTLDLSFDRGGRLKRYNRVQH